MLVFSSLDSDTVSVFVYGEFPLVCTADSAERMVEPEVRQLENRCRNRLGPWGLFQECYVNYDMQYDSQTIQDEIEIPCFKELNVDIHDLIISEKLVC